MRHLVFQGIGIAGGTPAVASVLASTLLVSTLIGGG
jgi:hypothetical protein